MTGTPETREHDAQVMTGLKLIHGAMVGGVLVFGAVVYAIASPDAAFDLGLVEWMPALASLAAVFAAAFLKGRSPRGEEISARRTPAILIWALLEGAALFGITLVLVTGEWYPAGLAAMIGLAGMVYHHPGTFR